MVQRCAHAHVSCHMDHASPRANIPMSRWCIGGACLLCRRPRAVGRGLYTRCIVQQHMRSYMEDSRHGGSARDPDPARGGSARGAATLDGRGPPPLRSGDGQGVGVQNSDMRLYMVDGTASWTLHWRWVLRAGVEPERRCLESCSAAVVEGWRVSRRSSGGRRRLSRPPFALGARARSFALTCRRTTRGDLAGPACPGRG